MLGSHFVKRFVDVGQMIVRDVANELAVDFVVAHAAMQPTKKDNQLDARGCCDRKHCDDGHGCSRLGRDIGACM